MHAEAAGKDIVWKISSITWLTGFLLLIPIWLVFGAGVTEMVANWEREEYSHGYLIPVIALFLVWQQKNKLEGTPFEGSWVGVFLIVVGLLLYVIGSLAAVVDIIQYGFVVTLYGLVLAVTGGKAFRLIAVPLLILLFMIPMPGFLYQSMSNELQLISSRLGVAIIRMFDIPVYLEGNVIDLGVYKLQVVEACSGLRYLFPLMTLGFIAAYFFKVELWKRVVVFLSTIPITIFMNSLRIGLIGVAVEYWGIKAAEGMVHDFEGWAVFMFCIVILVVEMAILARIGRKQRRSLQQVFGLELPEPSSPEAIRKTRAIQSPYIASFAILVVASIAVNAMPERSDVIPKRESFALFPEYLGEWSGRVTGLDQIYVDQLRFDDYLMADYSRAGNAEPINLYIGYYAIQRADKVPHSPKACLPGGGWIITDLVEMPLPNLSVGGVPLRVNRVVIEKGEYKQIVYYWFQERRRVITNEWTVKLFLLIDSMRESRTDGALVRLTTLIKPGDTMEDGDKRLQDIISYLAPILPRFVPN